LKRRIPQRTGPGKPIIKISKRIVPKISINNSIKPRIVKTLNITPLLNKK